jgi:hypothetical protein
MTRQPSVAHSRWAIPAGCRFPLCISCSGTTSGSDLCCGEIGKGTVEKVKLPSVPGFQWSNFIACLVLKSSLGGVNLTSTFCQRVTPHDAWWSPRTFPPCAYTCIAAVRHECTQQKLIPYWLKLSQFQPGFPSLSISVRAQHALGLPAHGDPRTVNVPLGRLAVHVEVDGRATAQALPSEDCERRQHADRKHIPGPGELLPQSVLLWNLQHSGSAPVGFVALQSIRPSCVPNHGIVNSHSASEQGEHIPSHKLGSQSGWHTMLGAGERGHAGLPARLRRRARRRPRPP